MSQSELHQEEVVCMHSPPSTRMYTYVIHVYNVYVSATVKIVYDGACHGVDVPCMTTNMPILLP